MLNQTIKLYLKSIKYDQQKSLDNDINILFLRLESHILKIPDFLNFGLRVGSFFFFFYYFIFKNKSSKSSFLAFKRARKSNFFLFRDYVRFLDSLFEIANSNNPDLKTNTLTGNFTNKPLYDFLIIGSGPGGSVSAKLLREQGFNVCIIEQGGEDADFKISPYSYNEMREKYINAGINTTFGNCKITFVEGKILGGGSEVNSGLYHRIPQNILKDWEKKYLFKSPKISELNNIYETIEKEISISYFPKDKIPKASLKLAEGAKKLNWSFQEVPRWFKYFSNDSDAGKKMSMSQTYLRKYIQLNGEYRLNAKATKVEKLEGNWQTRYNLNKKEHKILSKHVIFAAGTIGTVSLLKKSKLSKLAGKTFQMHPTIKIVALFDEKINEKKMGVPVHQVKEFAPEISFGCSISSKPFLNIAMLDHPNYKHLVKDKWENMAIYYAMILPKGKGKIRHIPGFKSPFLSYHLTEKDKANLAKGLNKLSELLLSCGAKVLFPSIPHSTPIKQIKELKSMENKINSKKTSLMTVHVFSSCPAGENLENCVVDSYGKIHGYENLYIADGSILPTALGVNPQGAIMTLSYLNTKKILKQI